MDGEAIERIQSSARAEQRTVEVDGTTYNLGGVTGHPLIYDPRPDTLDAASLTAIVDFVKLMDAEREGDWTRMIHVEGPGSVAVVGPEEAPTMKRTVWLRAKTPINGFRFGQPYDPESFNIALQSLFVDNLGRAQVLQLTGTIKSEEAETSIDDGITQTVEARRGVALVQSLKVVNPVTLQPWRTFREITQPSSLFVFRVHDGPKLALYEADGSAWQLEAMQSIKAYLSDKLTGIAIIA